MIHERDIVEHVQGLVITERILKRQREYPEEVEATMDGISIQNGRCLDPRGFILSNSVPLSRSQTLESNAREVTDTKKVRRRSSHGILRENLNKRRLSLRSGRHELRLPSFEALGIAARFSKYSPFTPKYNIQNQSHQSPRARSPPPISPKTPIVPPSSSWSDPTSSASHHLYPTHGFSFPLTPPDERTSIDFSLPIESHTETRDSYRAHHASPSIAVSDLLEQSTMTTAPGEAPISTSEGTLATLNTMGDLATSLSVTPGENTDASSPFWLDEGIIASVSTIDGSSLPGDSVRVLSQSLPCPPQESTLAASTFAPTFGPVVQAIQTRLHPGQSPYIYITHAMPNKSSLSSLPQSPPSTPGFAAADDYFSTTVFSSAAPVPTYHDSRGLLNPSLPSSPAPAVPPSSVHVSIVERYTPPSSVQEVLDLFSPSGPSVLLDRLVELSPNGGNLIFLFPTKDGGTTFKNEYLGPILDPLLRHLITMHDLSTDIGSSLGTMSAVDSMLEFNVLKRKINNICRELNRPGRSTTPSSGKYSVVHATTGFVPVARAVWAEWWCVQESTRIKEILHTYWRTTKRLPTDKAVTASSLWRDILEGVKTRDGDVKPANGIEMGVFVIRRQK